MARDVPFSSTGFSLCERRSLYGQEPAQPPRGVESSYLKASRNHGNHAKKEPVESLR